MFTKYYIIADFYYIVFGIVLTDVKWVIEKGDQ